MSDRFFDRRILGIKNRGVRLDPQTRQNVQIMPHIGDIEYPLKGDTAISQRSELRMSTNPSRELMLNAVIHGDELNEVGQSRRLIKRTPKSRYVELD